MRRQRREYFHQPPDSWLAWLLPWRLRGTRRGVEVDPVGFTEYHWFARSHRRLWSDVRAVHRAGPDGARIELVDGGCVEWGEPLEDWRQLADYARDAVKASAARAARQVTQRRVESWLGLEPGGTLLLGRDLRGWQYLAGVLCLLAGLADPKAIVAGAVLLVWAVVWPVWWAEAAADAFELRVRQGAWRHIPWSEVDGVAQQLRSTFDSEHGRSHYQVWEFRTQRGNFDLKVDLPGVERVARTAKKLVRARHEGRPLPGDTDVPATALSLAEAPRRLEGERGLSLVDAGGDDA